MDALRRTPLCDWHIGHGGRMVDFAGWWMPVQYGSIVEEHRATRGAAGLFDISHMGRLRLDGSAAGRYLDGLLTRRVGTLKPGQVRYSLVTNDRGGVLDDVLVYAFAAPGSQPWFLLVVNASNRAKIVDWFDQHPAEGDVRLVDRTLETAMIAVQGPRALELAGPLVSVDVRAMKYYQAREVELAGGWGLVSRTGYTGEDGCELVVAAERAASIWEQLVTAGEQVGARAAGLGARDTLRLEAAMPLYGHELDESTDPFTADLGFAVQLEGRRFPGSERLRQLSAEPPGVRRVGLELSGRRVAREGYRVLADGQPVGRVTSGTFSPSLERSIAMGYVQAAWGEAGSQLQVDVRGQPVPARVVPLPFYRRP